MEGTLVREISQDEFESAVLREHKPVVVDFWAPWCGPCRMVGPIIDDLAEELEGKVKMCKVNVDDESKLAHEYGVMSIPTVIIFKNGKVVDKVVGARDKNDFRELIEASI